MKKAFIILGVISVSCNIILASVLMSKGIVYTYNNYITNDQRQWQQQWTGQFLVNQFMVQGNDIDWKVIVIEGDTFLKRVDRAREELLKLHPISSLYSKIDISPDMIVIIYSDIFTKTKEIEIKK